MTKQNKTKQKQTNKLNLTQVIDVVVPQCNMETWWQSFPDLTRGENLLNKKVSGAALALIQYKMSSYQYRKSHCGDKTVVRSSYLHNGISYTGKVTSLYWIKALGATNLSLVSELCLDLETSRRVYVWSFHDVSGRLSVYHNKQDIERIDAMYYPICCI